MSVLCAAPQINHDILLCGGCGNPVTFKNGGLHYTSVVSQIVLCSRCALPVAISITLDALEVANLDDDQETKRRLEQLVKIGEQADDLLSIYRIEDNQ